jgi:hypothetical protein
MGCFKSDSTHRARELATFKFNSWYRACAMVCFLKNIYQLSRAMACFLKNVCRHARETTCSRMKITRARCRAGILHPGDRVTNKYITISTFNTYHHERQNYPY